MSSYSPTQSPTIPPGAASPVVIVVGSVNTDMVVSTASLPQPGETVLGEGPEVAQGGKGANSAVAAARLGARVHLVACVGDDAFGERALEDLAAEGVASDEVVVARSTSTGMALIGVEPGGQNLIMVGSGANAVLSAQHVEAALTRILERETSADHPPAGLCVVVCLEIPDDAVRAALRWGREHGVRVALDPAPAHDSVLDMELAGVFLTPNSGEAAALTGLADPVEAGRRLSAASRQPVWVTLGSEGVVRVESSSAALDRVPVPSGITAVDGTGAGDTFVAALAIQLAIQAPWSQATRFAVAAGSLSTGAQGARAGMPTAEQVQRTVERSWATDEG